MDTIFQKLKLLTGLASLLCIMLATNSAYSHHAFTAQYDVDKPIELEGVVIKVEWLNPHAYFYIDVMDEETGEIVTWACELGSPVSLQRQGWSRNSLALGEIIEVGGSLARDGSASLNAQQVVVESTGERLFSRRE